MKRSPAVIYPFLFTFYAVVGVYAQNIGNISIIRMIRSLLTILIVATLFYFFLRSRTGDNHRAGLLFILFLAWFFFGHVYRLLVASLKLTPSPVADFILLALWSMLLLLLGTRKAWEKIKNPELLTNFLNVTSWIILILPLYLTGSSALRIIHQNKLVREQRNRSELLTTSDISVHPDIYLIILDAYGRADFIEKAFHYNNSEFITFLEEKGFFIAEQSRTNYPQTLLSVSSMLNMNYLDNWTRGLEKSNNRIPLNEMIFDSNTRKVLENLEYTYIDSSFLAEYNASRDDKAQPDESKVLLNRFERLLLSTTVLDIFVRNLDLNLPLPTYETHRNDIENAFEYLKNSTAIESPKFVYVHILAPHPPFVYDEEGNPIQPDYPYTMSDGEAYPGSIEDYATGYAKEIVYLNHEMESVITTILEDSQTPPIIILQGDHGPGNYFTILGPNTEPCLEERYSILNAYYFPDQNYEYLYPAITPVNSFRAVFNTYFDANLPLLEDRNYYASYAYPYRFTDITDRASTCTVDFSP